MSSNPPTTAIPRVGVVVNQRVEQLQRSFLGDSATARALLAQLRHAARKPPGFAPEVWNITSYPVSEYASDAPTFEEHAVHDALTLYAIAQQGNPYAVHERSDRVHQHGFGNAVRALAWQSGAEESRFRRRFNAAVTSESYDELLQHVSSLFRQIFKSKLRISLDFGALAEDLFTFQLPDGPERVRRRWARQYATPPYQEAAD